MSFFWNARHFTVSFSKKWDAYQLTVYFSFRHHSSSEAPCTCAYQDRQTLLAIEISSRIRIEGYALFTRKIKRKEIGYQVCLCVHQWIYYKKHSHLHKTLPKIIYTLFRRGEHYKVITTNQCQKGHVRNSCKPLGSLCFVNDVVCAWCDGFNFSFSLNGR